MRKLNVCAAVLSGLLLCGCSMNHNDGTTNQTTENQPMAPSNHAMASIDGMMAYLKESGIEVTDMEPIEAMDFAAYEGRTFKSNGTTAYLYRLKSEDASMAKLLEKAKNEGSIDVNQNGEKKTFKAVTNGEMLLVYTGDQDMSALLSAFPNYAPNATSVNPNANATTSNGKNEADENTEE